MANVTMTQAQAIRYLIDNAVDAPTDVIEAAEKLYAAKTKKYDRPNVPTKAQRENMSLIDPLVEFVAAHPDDMVNTIFIKEYFNHPAVRSTQKAASLANMAVKQGKLEKYTEKNRVYFRAV